MPSYEIFKKTPIFINKFSYRLSDEVPLNISSSYDTLRVRQGKWVPQTPNMSSAEETEKSFYKQVTRYFIIPTFIDS